MRPIKLSNTPQQPATEQELVEALIGFANGANVEINAVLVPPAPAGFALPAEDLWGFASPDSPQPQSWDAVWAEKLGELRKDLRARLDESLQAPDAAAAKAVRTWHWHRIQTVLRLAPGGLKLTLHYPVGGIAELCDIALTLMLDVDKGFSGNLCRCQLASCGRYFFVDRSAGNRPRTRYCCTEHMLAYHGGDKGAARVRKHRQQQRRKAGAPGRS